MYISHVVSIQGTFSHSLEVYKYDPECSMLLLKLKGLVIQSKGDKKSEKHRTQSITTIT